MGTDWRKDLAAARAEAKEKGRLLVVHFSQDERPICRAMREETFADAAVAAALERFVPLRVDPDAERALFESMIGSRGVLATCVSDADDDVVSTLKGFAGPKAFLLFLSRAEEGWPALREARQASAAAPGDGAKRFALAEAYRALDSLRRAEACYAQVGSPAAHERLARLAVMRGKNLEAREHLRSCVPVPPGVEDRLLLTEGLALAIERKHAEAAKLLRNAATRFPSSAEADHIAFALGFVLHQDGQDKEALGVLESGVARFPDSPWLLPMREQLEHLRNPQPDHTH